MSPRYDRFAAECESAFGEDAVGYFLGSRFFGSALRLAAVLCIGGVSSNRFTTARNCASSAFASLAGFPSSIAMVSVPPPQLPIADVYIAESSTRHQYLVLGRMAEAMEPEAVVTMLREFHDLMTAQIFKCGGTVEKYIGMRFSRSSVSRKPARTTLRAPCDVPTRCLPHWLTGTMYASAPRATARYRHRPELRPGSARRCRQCPDALVYCHR